MLAHPPRLCIDSRALRAQETRLFSLSLERARRSTNRAAGTKSSPSDVFDTFFGVYICDEKVPFFGYIYIYGVTGKFRERVC